MQPKVSEYLVNYRKLKEERIQYLKNNYSGKKNTIHKTPWFMLTKGKQYNYEQRKELWGTQTDYFKVDSEMKKLTKRHVILRGVRGECKLELYTEHKLNKWIKRNPKPCDDRDLFVDQYLPKWENSKKEAEIQIKNELNFLYNKKFKFDSEKAITLYIVRNIYSQKYNTKQFITNIAYRGNDIIYICNIKPNETITIDKIIYELKEMFKGLEKANKPLKVIFKQNNINIIVNKNGTTRYYT